MKPAEPMVRLNLARTYLALGRADNAREEYERAMKLDVYAADWLSSSFITEW